MNVYTCSKHYEHVYLFITVKNRLRILQRESREHDMCTIGHRIKYRRRIKHMYVYVYITLLILQTYKPDLENCRSGGYV